jgi:hypothetical protein
MFTDRSDNLLIPAGQLYISPFAGGVFNPTPQEWMPLGNTPTFSITMEPQKQDHYSSKCGQRTKDRSVVTQMNRTASFEMEDINPDNMRLAFFGVKTEVTNAAAAGLTETITAAQKGYVYSLGVDATNPLGVRNIDNVTITSGGTPLVEGTDFVVDKAAGAISLLLGGTVIPATGADIDVTYDVVSSTYAEVASSSKSVIAALRFIPCLDEDSEMRPVEFFIPKAELTPSGQIDILSEDWMKLPIQMEIYEPPSGSAITAIFPKG